MKNFAWTGKQIAVTGVVAAIYAVLTLALSPLSYGAVQIRLSEAMLVLFLLDRRFAPGLILGCAIANLFSPLGLIDVVVGTGATALALWAMAHTKSAWLALLWPAVTNGALVGLELWVVDHLPFWFGFGTVALGELAAVLVVGGILYKWLVKSGVLKDWLAQRG